MVHKNTTAKTEDEGTERIKAPLEVLLDVFRARNNPESN